MIQPRVLLADDHEEILHTVSQLLTPHFDVVGSVMDGESLVTSARLLQPDVLVVDISMPVVNGIDAVTTLKGTGFSGRVIFLTIHSEPEFVAACLAAGGNGFVLKNRLTTDLVHAVSEALSNRTFVSPLHLKAC
jgi:DNA-binding NarL/FixJ family response regulator